jgi:hypothetical protein
MSGLMNRKVAYCLIIQVVFLLPSFKAAALPPPEDLPEEILRTEVITEARSPINGQPMTAAEYAALEAELQQQPELYETVSPDLRALINLLRLRRTVRTFIPFIR